MLEPHGPRDFHLNKLETSCSTDVSVRQIMTALLLRVLQKIFKALFPLKPMLKCLARSLLPKAVLEVG